MRILVMVIAGLWILMGFYLVRYGVLAGLVERSIRTTKSSQQRVTGLTAVGWGLFYMFLGMALLVGAAHMLLWAFDV